MSSSRRPWPLSAVLLVAFGTTLIGIGAFFMLLRPQLLPEDIRFIGLSLEQLQSEQPRMASWLLRVFQVLGGYAVAAGILTVAIAATSFREHRWIALAGVLLAGSVSIGWMVVVNFAIGSDFRWILLGVALLWAASLCLFVVELRQATTAAPAATGNARHNRWQP